MKTDYVQERHGLSKHPLMIVRNSIKQRCCNSNEPGYELYGARGITLCEEWRVSFMSFYNWCMDNGWKKGLHIDRIDNNKGYCPENCRITTPKINARNRNNNVFITWNGETRCAAEWAEITGADPQRIVSRYRKGMALHLVFSSEPACRPSYLKIYDKKKSKGHLTENRVKQIKQFISGKILSTLEIAVLFGVSYQSVTYIKRGRTWANIK